MANHPELVDLNGPGQKIPQFWNHMNTISYNPDLDQIMMSARGNSEAWVIDHKTSTTQAAGHTGGRYNKGGDLLYRWGNPQEYNLGAAASQMLYQQHDTEWIPAGRPGAGHILIFNNGIGRNYSTIDEITPPVDAAGNYSRTAGAAFGPAALTWTYKAPTPADFYSAEISGAQRLPNGNTLICEGLKGNLFEVTTAGLTVWRYVCPVTDSGPMRQGATIPADPRGGFMNAVFQVDRYAPDYPGLAGHTLTPQGPIELPATDAPEIQVLSGTTEIADGAGSVAFGSTPIGTPVSKTFTVRNIGTLNLTLATPITVPAGFTLTSSFKSTTLAPNAATSFTVSLNAAVVGSYSGTVSFANNDGDENPFNFTISGSVTGDPEIDVLNGTVSVPDGTGTVTFGSTTVGKSISKTFSVKNLGGANLTLTAPISIPVGFTVTSSFNSTTLAPAATATFTIRLDATAIGSYSGTMTFANNDSNENPYKFTISGTVARANAARNWSLYE